jgi:AraC-like DNA-binding protein
MADAAQVVSYPEYELLEARYVEHRFGMHAHDSLVLAVLEGGAERLRVERRRWLALPGDLVLIGPGAAHDGAGHDRNGFAYRAVYPLPGLVARALGLPPAALDAGCFPRNVVRDPAAADALRVAHRRLTAGDDPLAGETALVHALGVLLGRHATVTGRGRLRRPDGRAATARDLIEARLSERVSLLELAQACGATPLRLLREFQGAYGLPPHRYQLQRRVQLAQGRLRAGADLAALAAELGFADQSHFTRVFKSVVGVSPGAYQRAAAARS